MKVDSAKGGACIEESMLYPCGVEIVADDLPGSLTLIT
jgi:hypothetical protein